MKTIFNEKLTAFNRLDNQMDQVYNSYLSSHKISMTTMWILYSTYTSNGTSTQAEICENWCCVPQTINSALKVLEKSGLVKLSFVEGNRKNKQIRLTDRGMELCVQSVEPLIHAENMAFSTLTTEEQKLLVSLSQKYIVALQNELSTPVKQKRSK